MFDNQLCLRVFNPNVDISLGFKLCTIHMYQYFYYLKPTAYTLPRNELLCQLFGGHR